MNRKCTVVVLVADQHHDTEDPPMPYTQLVTDIPETRSRSVYRDPETELPQLEADR